MRKRKGSQKQNSRHEQELLTWKTNIHHLRIKYRDTTAGYQDDLEQEAVFMQLLLEEENVKEKEKREILNPPLLPDPRFFGREKELLEIDEHLKENHYLFLCGIASAGKTTLAKNYAFHRQEKGALVLVLSYGKNLCETIASDSNLLISGMRYDPQVYQNITGYFLAKLKILKTYAQSQELLLIIDNFNRETDRYFQKLQRELPCDMIFTSRSGSSAYGSQHTLYVNRFSEEYLVNPSCQTKNLSFLDGYNFRRYEKRILLSATLLPSEGMPLDLFCMLFQLEPRKLERLLRWQLLELQDPEGKKQLTIAPAIAEEILKRTPLDIQNCKFLLDRLISYLDAHAADETARSLSFEETALLEQIVLIIVEKLTPPPYWYLKNWNKLTAFLGQRQYPPHLIGIF